jgi:hypothetical protein
LRKFLHTVSVVRVIAARMLHIQVAVLVLLAYPYPYPSAAAVTCGFVCEVSSGGVGRCVL